MMNFTAYHGVKIVSEYVAPAIAGMMPVDSLGEEVPGLYHGPGASSHREVKNAERWQQGWEQLEKGPLTHRLISNITVWTQRRHGKIKYNLMHFLRWYGWYGRYLHRVKLTRSSNCPSCDGVPEHFHVFRDSWRKGEFYCGRVSKVGSSLSYLLPSICLANWKFNLNPVGYQVIDFRWKMKIVSNMVSELKDLL